MHTTARELRTVLLATLLWLWSASAQANCGQAVCAINTDWETQGAPVDTGTRFDLRFEYIDQDQPRAGRDRVGVGEVARHHDEVRSINRNGIATLDHAFNARWAVTVSAPFLSRIHHHIHHHNGDQETETWSYLRAGDVRVLARFQSPLGDDGGASWGVTGGVKLPTGRHDIRNDAGELAERTLQPGTGTTDGIAGVFAHRSLASVEVFLQGQYQFALNEVDHYQPAARLALDVGVRYPLTDSLALLAQINYLWRGRDRGDEAEPEDSGGRFVFLSPGLSLALSRQVRLYSFVQLPLYQHVNGVQLTADWSASAGISVRF